MDPITRDELAEVYEDEERPDGSLAHRGRTRAPHLVTEPSPPWTP